MRVVFVGASKFGLRCLEAILQVPEVQVVGVVSAPRTFPISYSKTGVTNVLYADFGSLCDAYSIPYAVLKEGMKDDVLQDAVNAWKPDCFLVVGWYHMVPKTWRALAPAYGLHASLLPDYSGGAPLVWAIINGETKTGITLFEMDEGVDAGPILGQAEEPIYPHDTIATLYARIEERGLNLITSTLPKLASGTAVGKRQDDAKRRVFPQRSPEDGLIDWSADSIVIDRFIRAQTNPYPGAFSWLDGQKVTVWEAGVSVAKTAAEPGTIFDHNAEVCVSCGSGTLSLKRIRFQGEDFEGERIAAILRPKALLGRL